MAWILLATQGVVAAAVPQCSAADPESNMESTMAPMSTHAGMQMDSHPEAATSVGCQHCHSHTQGHGCSGLHSCSAQLAAARPLSLAVRIAQLHAVLFPAALPRLATLAFDPPLRPPPA